MHPSRAHRKTLRHQHRGVGVPGEPSSCYFVAVGSRDNPALPCPPPAAFRVFTCAICLSCSARVVGRCDFCVVRHGCDIGTLLNTLLLACHRQQEVGGEGDTGPVKQMKDLSIAEGEKVHLGLKVRAAPAARYTLYIINASPFVCVLGNWAWGLSRLRFVKACLLLPVPRFACSARARVVLRAVCIVFFLIHTW